MTTNQSEDQVPLEELHIRRVALPTEFRSLLDPYVVAAALLAVLLTYASELTSFTFSIDEEIFAYDPESWRIWVYQGRWAMALLSRALPDHASIPFVATFLFCLGAAFAAVTFAGTFCRNRAEAVAFVMLFCSAPIWPHMVSFNCISDGFGIGLALVASAVALLQREDWRSVAMAALLAAVAMGIHQSLFAVFFTGSLLVVVSGTSAGTPDTLRLVRSLLRTGACWLICVSVNALVAAVVMRIAHEHLRYVDQVVRLGDFLSAETRSVALWLIRKRIFTLMSGTDAIYLGWGPVILSLTWLGATWSLVRLRLRGAGAILSALILSAALASGFATLIGSAGQAPSRSLGALVLLHALGGAAAMRFTRFGHAPHWALLAYIMLVNVTLSTSLFHADAVARKRDDLMATEIAERLRELDLPRDRAVPFTVIGRWQHEHEGPALRLEVFGNSFFEFNGGDPYRIRNYLRYMGITGLEPVHWSAEQRQRGSIASMPRWPEKGSLAVVDGTVVLKLSPP